MLYLVCIPDLIAFIGELAMSAYAYHYNNNMETKAILRFSLSCYSLYYQIKNGCSLI